MGRRPYSCFGRNCRSIKVSVIFVDIFVYVCVFVLFFNVHLYTCIVYTYSVFGQAFLKKFLRGKNNTDFWQKMVKEVEDPYHGSGSYNTLNGWINNLIPYWFSDSVNKYMRPWQAVSSEHKEGGATDSLPSCMEHVPVNWDDHGRSRDFQFYSGIFAYTQDSETFAIKPITGYFVVEEFEKEPVVIAERLKKEIRDLEKCSAENQDNKTVISLLRSRLESLKYMTKSFEKGDLMKRYEEQNF